MNESVFFFTYYDICNDIECWGKTFNPPLLTVIENDGGRHCCLHSAIRFQFPVAGGVKLPRQNAPQ